MLIGSDFVHYVITRMTKGREMLAGTEQLWKQTGEQRRQMTEEGRQLAKHLKALDSLIFQSIILWA